MAEETMKTRKMATVAVMAAALLASPYARAATTNEVDIAALVAAVDADLSETNGWTLSGLGKYQQGADYVSNPACVKFDSLNDWLQSPAYGKPIARIEAYVRCSATNNATRWLYVVDAKTGDRLWQFNACKKKDTLENQFYVFAPTSSVDQVRLLLDGSGQTGVWGVGRLTVVAADPADAPSNLQVSHNGGDWCTLSWENGAGIVSNRVETFSIERGIGDDVLLSTDFETFSAGGNVVRMDASLPGIDASLTGTNVYAQVNTNGICRVGKGDELGIIRYDGPMSYAGVNLSMTAMRYPGDKADTLIAYEHNGETNAIATLTLTDEFAKYTVDLSKDKEEKNTPGGAAILIGYYDTAKNNHRILIDSLEIVRTNTIVTTTSSVDSRWIPATQGAASFSTRDHEIGLVPKSEYRFEVRAQNADGLISDPSAVDVVLDSLPGFRFILR